MALLLTILLYNVLFSISLPIIFLMFLRRVYNKKDSLLSIGQKFVVSYIFSRQKKYDIWLHAASVGETKSMDFIIKKHIELGHKILVTTGTFTSKKIVTSYNNPDIEHRFIPLDFIPFILFFLYKHRVRSIIIAESEIWPNLFYTFKLLKMNAVLLNADISLKSRERWSRYAFVLSGLLSSCRIITAQNKTTATFLQKFHNNTHYMGNMKLLNLNAEYKPKNKTIIDFCQGDAPILTVASTHRGEDEYITEAIAKYRGKYKFIYVARHPERTPEVKLLLDNHNITYSTLSEYGHGKECLVIDSIGHLMDALYFSKISVYGGSFLPHLAGHNILEAGIFKVPVVTGQFVEAFQEIIDELKELNGIVQVDTQHIAEGIASAESDPEIGKRIYEYSINNKPDLSKIYGILGLQ